MTKKGKPISDKAQKVLDLINQGIIPTQKVITGSLVRGIRAGKESPKFPNGESIHPQIMETLIARGLVEKHHSDSFGTWGYMDKTYRFYPKGKAPKTGPNKEYAM
jgi:hypothetical protein